MKRIFINISMAALAMLSACQTTLPQEEEAVQYFTATIGEDTKTSLEYDATRDVYKVLWSEGDEILVVNAETGESEVCPIVEGIGTRNAKFSGTLKADKYYAIYGDNVAIEGNVPEVFVSPTQNNSDGLMGARFQMFAQSSSTSFSFKNLYSLIKLNVTAEEGEYLRDVYLTTNDITVAGFAQIRMSGNEPSLVFTSEESQLTLNAYVSLSSAPTPLYIMLPPQTYEGGFTLEFNLDSGTRTVTVTDDVVMNRSRIRNLNVNLSDESYEQPDKAFRMYVTTDGGNVWENFEMYDAGNGLLACMNVDMLSGAWYCFVEQSEGKTYGCSAQYRTASYKTNSRVNLIADSDWTYFVNGYEGAYDIYIDPLKCCVFIMDAGVTPYGLPTMDLVLHDSYSTIEELDDGDLVKVHGPILAKNGYGYILAIDGYYYNYVLIYDSQDILDLTLGCWVDLYAKVKTYNGMKELDLSEVCWYYVQLYQERDYDPETPVSIEYWWAYDSSSYDYVSVTGRLEARTDAKGKTNYTVVVDDPESFEVLISQPYQNLTEFVGKNVLVEGYHLGHYMSNSIPTLKIMLKRIWENDSMSGGSTENVLPGGSIIVTNN